ncbi:MAG TPA: GTP cyclohydrolase II [Candidatus Thermoplasmatota archaeon]|nr:GTP cyclohydrolase II [Candidatus Thermoplasmatota archaeon]
MKGPRAVRAAAARLPTKWGGFRIYVYRDVLSGKEHAALVHGDVRADGGGNVLCRIHSECLTGDIFRSLRCDCGPQLEESLRQIAREGRGLVVYLRQEGRDIGLTNKILAYELQEQGLDTVEANLQLGHPSDARTYDAARDILKDLGVASLRLLTNNPEKLRSLEELGFPIVERVSIELPPTDENKEYLATKKGKMGHMLGNV